MEQQAAMPQPVGDLLRAGFHLIRTGFGGILGMLLTQTICITALFVVLFSMTISLYDSSSPDIFQTGFIICLILSSLLILAVQLGFIAAFTAKFWAVSHGSAITSTQAYASGFSKALPLLLWLVLYILIVSTGLMLLFVPGLVLMVSLFMGAGLIIQNHISVPDAIKISHRLVWPYLRRTLLYLSLAILIVVVTYFATIFPLGLFIGYITSNNPMLSGIFDLVRYVLIVMLAPLFVALIIPYFMDLLQLQKNRHAA